LIVNNSSDPMLLVEYEETVGLGIYNKFLALFMVKDTIRGDVTVMPKLAIGLVELTLLPLYVAEE
jgi:hypothetical protein